MARKVKSLAWMAGESLGRSFNEKLIGDSEVGRAFRKAAKHLRTKSDYLEFVDGYNSMMLEVDKRAAVR